MALVKLQVKQVATLVNDATKQYLLDTEKENVFNAFDKGLTIEGYKLLPMQVPGGTVLVPSTFTLKE